MSASLNIKRICYLPDDVQCAFQAAKKTTKKAQRKLDLNFIQKKIGSNGNQEVNPLWAVKQVRALKDLKEHLYYLEINPQEVPELQRKLVKFEFVCQRIQKRFPELFRKDWPLNFSSANANLITPLSDETRLTDSHAHWEIHFALLLSAYEKTENVELKKGLCFLMINYLAKAAFLNSSPSVHMSERHAKKYTDMAQLGLFLWGGLYHRSNFAEIPILRMLNMEQQIGNKHDIQGFLVDTDELQDLYPISFIPILDISDQDAAVAILCQAFESSVEKRLLELDSLEISSKISANLPAFLIDITQEIENSVFTFSDPGIIADYLERKVAAKKKLDEIIDNAAHRIKMKYSEYPVIQNWVEHYFKISTLVVSRAKRKEDGFGVLSVFHNFYNRGSFDRDNPDSKLAWELYNARNDYLDATFKSWLSVTGTGIGAVNLRMALASVVNDPEKLIELTGGIAVSYSIGGGKAQLNFFDKPTKILDTNLFKSICDIARGRFLNNPVGAGQRIQAEFTMAMMSTLLESIDEKLWQALQSQEPAIQEVLQGTCFRIQQHLSDAIQNVTDFRKFSQAIERVHGEMTSLLFFYSPFDRDVFDCYFRKYLEPILPEGVDIRGCGIAKSAMNVFAGVNAAVRMLNPTPRIAYCPHSYYEEQIVVGEHKTLAEVMANEAVEVDLYVTEFHHNIDIDYGHTHYEKGSVVQDIRELLKSTDQLTVAIDATIDYTRSADLEELLRELRSEIDAGRLNLVVFRSGQKFDMLGFDNYFGATYFLVNNGDAKWDVFQRLKTEAAHQTDPLSQQYFNWMAFTSLGIIDGYKDLIFKNTESILKTVPESLLPAPNRIVCVSTFADGVKTPFIDIRIGEENEELRAWAQQRFFELFIDADKIVYRRGSFGFAHPNFTWISPKLRINVGIDPGEIVLYEQFFNDLAGKVKEIELTNRQI